MTVGRDDDGSAVFFDPESAPGIVSLEGPDREARGVALSMAVDTGTHPWADDRLVTLVGFADDVTADSHQAGQWCRSTRPLRSPSAFPDRP